LRHLHEQACVRCGRQLTHFERPCIARRLARSFEAATREARDRPPPEERARDHLQRAAEHVPPAHVRELVEQRCGEKCVVGEKRRRDDDRGPHEPDDVGPETRIADRQARSLHTELSREPGKSGACRRGRLGGCACGAPGRGVRAHGARAHERRACEPQRGQREPAERGPGRRCLRPRLERRRQHLRRRSIR
jgi:hypothetical protein